MTTPLYYVYPFGENADDLTAIPTPAAGDGSVSYFAGWTDPYELDLLTNPSALPIPRGQMNQLFFDITNNLQEYQQYGAPQWVPAAQNLGSSLPYPIYATVYYSGVLYRNLVAANTATPGADATWAVVRTSTYVVDTSGAANTVTVPLVPAPAAYYAGMLLEVVIANTNTSATVVNVATLGNKAITYTTGNPLIGGELIAGGIALLQYDGTEFQLLNPVNASVISSVVASGSAINLSTGSAANVTHIDLTPGKWIVTGNVFVQTSGGAAADIFAWQQTGNTPTQPDASLFNGSNLATGSIAAEGIQIPTKFYTVAPSTTTTVNLNIISTFASTATACGGIYALKVGD